jgi:hypothetical protein
MPFATPTNREEKMNSSTRFSLLALMTMLLPLPAAAKPVEPFTNPALAASSFAVTHMRHNFTSLAGPTVRLGPGRRLRPDEVQWKTVGPINATPPLYSAPYPNGKRVIWIGGYDRVAKLDAETLEILTTYAIGGNTYFGSEEIERDMAVMDALDDKGLLDYRMKMWASLLPSTTAFYRLLSSKNELYLPHQSVGGGLTIQVFGETDAADPASKIVLRREYKVPSEISRANMLGMNMTADGWLLIAMQDGVLIALSQDFTQQRIQILPGKRDEDKKQDIFSSFVRNSLSLDDRGGIYVVTREYLARVQWSSKGFSLAEADGAWMAAYPNEKGIGSGTSPGVMGWGPNEDHLVVIADGTHGNQAIAYWRDEIPAGWKALPGYERRVAGVTKIHFGVAPDEDIQIENSPVIYGYGAFFDNTYPESHLPELGAGPFKQFIAESFYFHVPGHGARGGAMVQWDPKTRTFKQAWQKQTNFASTVCTVSGATELLYCFGVRDREWTLEGINWKTGKDAFRYTLGKSQRYNVFGSPIVVAPNGAIDCGCGAGLGLVRVKPQAQGRTKR